MPRDKKSQGYKSFMISFFKLFFSIGIEMMGRTPLGTSVLTQKEKKPEIQTNFRLGARVQEKDNVMGCQFSPQSVFMKIQELSVWKERLVTCTFLFSVTNFFVVFLIFQKKENLFFFENFRPRATETFF